MKIYSITEIIELFRKGFGDKRAESLIFMEGSDIPKNTYSNEEESIRIENSNNNNDNDKLYVDISNTLKWHPKRKWSKRK